MALVYRHIRLDSNQPFYIGIGQDEKRAYSTKGRNDHWKRIVQKHGYKVHIMMDDLTWEEACEKEREFIQLYGRKDLGLGTLVNMTDGGEGKLNYITSDDTKKILSEQKIGLPLTEQHKQSLQKPKKARTETHIMNLKLAKTGKKYPNLSAAMTGKKRGKYNKTN